MNGTKKKLINEWYSEFLSFTGVNLTEQQTNKVMRKIKKEKTEFIRNDIKFMREERIKMHNRSVAEIAAQRKAEAEAAASEEVSDSVEES